MAAPCKTDVADNLQRKTRKTLTDYIILMAEYKNFVCFLLSTMITLFSMMSFSTPETKIIQAGQPPKPFFARKSQVIDIYNGDMHMVATLAQNADITFAMYYAPWDANCMSAKKEFSRVARYFHSQVQFLAVNCWWRDGQCHRENTIYSYPIFMLYPSTDKSLGVEYLGLHNVEYFIHFLELAIRPLKHIRSFEDLLLFTGQHDVCVVGYFDFNSSPQPPGYLSFHLAAIRTIASDPMQPVKFAVVTSDKLAQKLSMDGIRKIFLYRMMNNTIIWPGNVTYTSERLAGWVKYYSQWHLTWVAPTGLKSTQLSHLMGSKPTLILFAPFYPLEDINFYFHILREVMLEYKDCNESSSIYDALVAMQAQRLQSIENNLRLETLCDRSQLPVHITKQAHDSCCQSIVVHFPSNVTSKCNFTCDFCVRILDTTLPTCGSDACYLLSKVQSEKKYHFLQRGLNLCNTVPSYVCDTLMTSNCDNMLFNETDNAHSHNKEKQPEHGPEMYLRNSSILHKCKRKRYLHSEASVKVPLTYEEYVFTPAVLGLQCKTNRSLEFLAMDSRYYSHFAHKLGANLSSAESTAVIVDKENEVQYIMEQVSAFSKQRLAEFVLNFTDGKLDRYLRSQTIAAKSDVSEENLIVEVTTHSFQHIVLDSDTDVLLLYYAPWCGFCAGFAHVYLSLARYFRSTKIRFARINAEENELPWEFTVQTYPTLIFFPAKRKSSSEEFPQTLALSLPNLVQFVLINSQAKTRLQAALSICTHSCMLHNRQQAASRTLEIQDEIKQLNTKQLRLQQSLASTRSCLENDRNLGLRDYITVLEQEKLLVLQDYYRRVHRRIRTLTLQSQSSKRLYEKLSKTSSKRLSLNDLEQLLSENSILREELQALKSTSLSKSL